MYENKLWFKLLMWGFFLLIIFSIFHYATTNRICGYDDMYDNNCGDLIN